MSLLQEISTQILSSLLQVKSSQRQQNRSNTGDGVRGPGKGGGVGGQDRVYWGQLNIC